MVTVVDAGTGSELITLRRGAAQAKHKTTCPSRTANRSARSGFRDSHGFIDELCASNPPSSHDIWFRSGDKRHLLAIRQANPSISNPNCASTLIRHKPGVHCSTTSRAVTTVYGLGGSQSSLQLSMPTTRSNPIVLHRSLDPSPWPRYCFESR